MNLGRAAIIVLGVVLAGCVGHRPDDAQACHPEAVTRAMAEAGPTSPRDKLDILVLSGGGPRGAYGAGFLKGWTARQTGILRPEFDIVTGVSTGAIMAPFALLGPAYDPIIEKNYNGIAATDLFTGRSWFSIFQWNSLKNADRMMDRMRASLDDPALAALAEAARKDRMVWVGATNYDTGDFTHFNLSEIALHETPAQAREDIATRIVAASSIPIFLPPRFIDGCMYLDGGVRENLFLHQIGGAIRAAMHNTNASRVDIYAVVNGPVFPERQMTDNTLIAVATRSFDLVVEQIQLASLRETWDFAHDNGYVFRWTSADGLVSDKAEPGKCGPEPLSDRFDGGFTACLFEAGRRKAQNDPAPWRTDWP